MEDAIISIIIVIDSVFYDLTTFKKSKIKNTGTVTVLYTTKNDYFPPISLS